MAWKLYRKKTLSILVCQGVTERNCSFAVKHTAAAAAAAVAAWCSHDEPSEFVSFLDLDVLVYNMLCPS
jgi:hypothetical protein